MKHATEEADQENDLQNQGHRIRGKRNLLRSALPLVLGFLSGLPFLGAVSATWPDYDSANLISSLLYVERHGFDWLIKSQEVVLPHIVLRPLLDVGGNVALSTFGHLSLAALGATISHISARVNSSLLAGIVSAWMLYTLPAIASLPNHLPMYAAMLTLAYWGIWLAYKASAISNPRAQWLMCLGAAVLLVLASEAHALGQLFLLAPLVLLGFSIPSFARAEEGLRLTFAPRNRLGLMAILKTYLMVAVLLIPRIITNFRDEGFYRLTANRNDFLARQGYIDIINQRYWGHPVQQELGSYLSDALVAIGNLLSGPGLILALGLGIAFAISGSSARRIGILTFGVFFLALILKRPPLFPRYFTPVLPAAAVAVGSIIPFAIRKRESLTLRTASLWIGAVLAVTAIVVGYLFSVPRTIRLSNDAEMSVLDSPIPRIADEITDRRNVMGVRSTALNKVEPTISTLGPQTVSERDFVTFLTWPSDLEVVDMFRARRVGWVFILPQRYRELEAAVHGTWLREVYGERTRHIKRIKASSLFCKHADIQGYLLFRLGRCSSS